MNRQDRAELDSRLALLDNNERQKLAKKASALRQVHDLKRTARPPRTVVQDDDEEGFANAPIRRVSLSLDEAMLRLLREETPANAAPPDGIVVALAKGRAWMQTPVGEIALGLAPEILAAQDRLIAVGDEVLIERDRVARILPRQTRLSRPDPQTGGERVVVANIDAAVIVVSVTAPPLHPRIIDRYLLACQKGSVAPVIAVNKWDLLDQGPPGQDALLDPYRSLGLSVIPVSAERGVGLAELRNLLRNRLVAFVGHSGVGKSSLVNALSPDLALEVGSGESAGARAVTPRAVRGCTRSATGSGSSTRPASARSDSGRSPPPISPISFPSSPISRAASATAATTANPVVEPERRSRRVRSPPSGSTHTAVCSAPCGKGAKIERWPSAPRSPPRMILVLSSRPTSF